MSTALTTLRAKRRLRDRGLARRGTVDGPTLLVASTGGHLEELFRLRERMGGRYGPYEWATFDDAQSRSLLRGERVHYVDYIAPRGYAAAAKDLPAAVAVLLSGRYGAVVSTGSGIALPFFIAARALRVPSYYIESAARVEGPSATGRLLRLLPGTRLFTQYPALADRRWAYRGSLFDGFGMEVPAVMPTPHRGLQRVVVTLGTMRTYGFRRAVERLTEALADVCAPDVDILWQVGATDVSGLGVEGHDLVPAHELSAAEAEADLVVAHAGIGSALCALDAGKAPVLLPRRSAYGEHVDDHQTLICADLDRRGIAVGREVADLTAVDLWEAAHRAVHPIGDEASFSLSQSAT